MSSAAVVTGTLRVKALLDTTVDNLVKHIFFFFDLSEKLVGSTFHSNYLKGIFTRKLSLKFHKKSFL